MQLYNFLQSEKFFLAETISSCYVNICHVTRNTVVWTVNYCANPEKTVQIDKKNLQNTAETTPLIFWKINGAIIR